MPDLSVAGAMVPLFVLLVPLSLACVEPAVAVLADVLNAPRAVFALGWLFGWVPLVLRPVQRAVGGWFFGVRELTSYEGAWIEPLWNRVLTTARVDAARYLLKVSDDAESPNATAAGGHIVSVTTGALRLPPAQLEAILAHELGHHLALHPVVALITYWLQLPVRGWIALLELSVRIAAEIARAGAGAGSGLFALVAASVALTCRMYAALLRVVVAALDLVLSATNRLAEYAADDCAVALGYGAPLRDALNGFIQQGLDQSSYASAWERLTSSHPPLRRRVARIDRHVP